MKEQKDYLQDIAEIRSMMERSSKFLSLSGWAGIMAGLYALAGAWLAYSRYGFNPDSISYSSGSVTELILLAAGILLLALITAIYFSWRNARNKGESIWNATSRRLLVNMAVPFLTGALLIVILTAKGMLGLVPPMMLLFYGLALYNAGHFTIMEVHLTGIVQILLGLAGCWFIEYGMILWAVGFGAIHMVYGIYMHFRYER